MRLGGGPFSLFTFLELANEVAALGVAVEKLLLPTWSVSLSGFPGATQAAAAAGRWASSSITDKRVRMRGHGRGI